MSDVKCAAPVALAALFALISLPAPAADAPPPPGIESIEIGSQSEFRVNGQPFFPLMAWLQDAENFPAVKACGMNATAGYWQGSSGTKDVVEYIQLVQRAGLYGVLPFDERLPGHPALLGYIHDDEPDLPHQVNDAEIVPGEGLAINRQTPLWKLVDGVTHTWSVLDPLAEASLTIVLPKPVTATAVAVWPTVSAGLPVARDVVFHADGREILSATLKAEKGQQRFGLSQPATFKQLKLTVRSVYPGEREYGSLGEIEAFDESGTNVLLSPPRHEPRTQPAPVLAEYQRIRKADPSRPVFMTLTGHFHPHFDKWNDSQRQDLYPAYIRAADVVGYDIYPIYGWNRPDWLHLVHEATELLVAQAAPRPVYAWIETSRGGQWTGALERQHEVTPEHIRAEVWMAICRGATAIGYFTHVWKPAYEQFGVPEANRQALRQINDQITRLSPILLSAGSPPAAAIPGQPKVDLMARQHGDQLYLFAVNFGSEPLDAPIAINVPGLAAGQSVQVVDEGRSLNAEAGGFKDSFAPLAVHIYRIKNGSGADEDRQ